MASQSALEDLAPLLVVRPLSSSRTGGSRTTTSTLPTFRENARCVSCFPVAGWPPGPRSALLDRRIEVLALSDVRTLKPLALKLA